MVTTATPPQSSSIPIHIKRHLQSTLRGSLMLPTVAMDALEVVKDPRCTIGEFSRIVERDLRLVTEIIAQSNSILFSPDRPVTSLHQSVLRLGFKQCQNLILSASLSSLMQRLPLEGRLAQELLWRHSITTAITSVHLNRLLGLGFQGEDFTAGLIHDMGRMLIAVSYPDRFEEIDPLDFEETDGLTEAERDILGTDHCVIGAWYAEENRLPIELREVLLAHHGDHPATINPRLVALTMASDHLANHVQRHGKLAEYPCRENPGLRRLEELGSLGAVEHVGELCESLLADVIHQSLDMSKPLHPGQFQRG
jgi:HD-like signal output (HDOD) protein